MPYRRGLRTINWITPSYRTMQRIKIPQPVERPLTIRPATALKKEFIRPYVKGFVLHRRSTRELVGIDQREALAVPASQVRGTLPERIVYKMLRDVFKMRPGYDFDFQSSLQGGRLETGGIVADFIIYPNTYAKFIIQVQGSTHKQFIRAKKDEEQKSILSDLGYQVYDLWEIDIYNPQKLYTILQKLLRPTRLTQVKAYNATSTTDIDTSESETSGATYNSLNNIERSLQYA